MTGPNLPEIPAPLKSIQQYLKIAVSHDQRDPVVSYWCRLYALQTGLKLSTKTTEETNFLLKLMDWLEATKKELHENEAITNEVAAQAHLENWALKLFLYADKNDRASNFSKNVIQSFYTAGLLYDVLMTFGELTDEAVQNRKYAKWKATYIHNCLKNGETPIPGPIKEEGEDDEENSNENFGQDPPSVEENVEDPEAAEETANKDEGEGSGEEEAPDESEASQPNPPSNLDAFGFPSVPTTGGTPKSTSGESVNVPQTPDANPYNPAPTPTSRSVSYDPDDLKNATQTEGGVDLTPEQMTKAQKYIKWAGSALNYDDVPTAVLNIRKALQLLTTGQDPA